MVLGAAAAAVVMGSEVAIALLMWRVWIGFSLRPVSLVNKISVRLWWHFLGVWERRRNSKHGFVL